MCLRLLTDDELLRVLAGHDECDDPRMNEILKNEKARSVIDRAFRNYLLFIWRLRGTTCGRTELAVSADGVGAVVVRVVDQAPVPVLGPEGAVEQLDVPQPVASVAALGPDCCAAHRWRAGAVWNKRQDSRSAGYRGRTGCDLWSYGVLVHQVQEPSRVGLRSKSLKPSTH